MDGDLDGLYGKDPGTDRAGKGIQMLYSANRYEMKEKVLSSGQDMDILILDRYSPSRLACGSGSGAKVASLDAGLPRPT